MNIITEVLAPEYVRSSFFGLNSADMAAFVHGSTHALLPILDELGAVQVIFPERGATPSRWLIEDEVGIDFYIPTTGVRLCDQAIKHNITGEERRQAFLELRERGLDPSEPVVLVDEMRSGNSIIASVKLLVAMKFRDITVIPLEDCLYSNRRQNNHATDRLLNGQTEVKCLPIPIPLPMMDVGRVLNVLHLLDDGSLEVVQNQTAQELLGGLRQFLENDGSGNNADALIGEEDLLYESRSKWLHDAFQTYQQCVDSK